VSASNSRDYLAAGAVALGVGTSIANPVWAREGTYDRFEEAAGQLLASL
jgi:2-keto-3-deoxy-6-phosphogluconate aldolase